MQMKIFSSDTQSKVEAVVNEWLAEQSTSVTIHVSETSFHLIVNPAGFKTPLVTVTVWYS